MSTFRIIVQLDTGKVTLPDEAWNIISTFLDQGVENNSLMEDDHGTIVATVEEVEEV